MRAAADLLARASSADGLTRLLSAAGIACTPFDPIEADSLEPLGLEPGTLIAAGAGAIRVLVIERNEKESREQVRSLVGRLGSRAPHVLWLVGRVNGSTTALIGWQGGERSRRIASFSWQPAQVVDSDAETLCALQAARAPDDELTYARYFEILGRDALNRRFYRELERRVAELASDAAGLTADAARPLALLYVSRLLFLCFLEAKGWLNGERGFLSERFDDAMRRGGGFHQRVLLPLFFGTLNTPVARRARAARELGAIPFLNGGLFARTSLERTAGGFRFGDQAMGSLFTGLLRRFRFVAREDSATWSEASVDPEMLGHAFESLMARADRKAGGVFFTPHPLVARVTDEALQALPADLRSLRSIRVLDPACGSGAFLVYALEQIAERRRVAGEPGDASAIRRDTLARQIFGVDRDPTAVWLCELRLWLSVVIDLDAPDPLRVPPLPNLDRNVRVGDALAGAGFGGAPATLIGGRRVGELRNRYVRASGPRKAALARALDREERRRELTRLDAEIIALVHARAEQAVALRSRDLFGARAPSLPRGERQRLRDRLRAVRRERQRLAGGGALPFSWEAFFGEVRAAGGFDMIVGNPPWVRLHRIPERLRGRFRESFEAFRGASWEAGARRARAGAGFASQVDLSALFVERALHLLRPEGVMSLLLPVKLWQSLSGGGVRRLVRERCALVRLEDLSGSRHTFDAAVYPSLLVARRTECSTDDATLARFADGCFREWRVTRATLPYDQTPGAPWIILPPPARAAFERLRVHGLPLSETAFGAPRLGVKSGCNAAFLVRVLETTSRTATVEDADGQRGKIELTLLRPALRGDAVRAWRRDGAGQWIIWTHDDRGPLPILPDGARAWLGRRYGALTARADASRSRRWWSLYRVDAAACDRPRVVWADVGRTPRALVLPANDPAVPLNSCYVVRCADDTDAWALAAVLNSAPAAAWLNALAECARGGYRRYMGWTVGELPLPRDWHAVRDALAAAGHRAAAGAPDDDLRDAVLASYGMRLRDARSLIEACGS